MTPLAKNAERSGKIIAHLQDYLVENDVHIYKNALVVLNNAGYLEPATNAVGKVLAGIAREECDNTLAGHTQGGKSCRADRGGIWKIATADITQAEVGLKCYVADDNSVADRGTATQGVVAGVVAAVETGYAWVDIEPGTVVGALSTAVNAD